MDAKGKMVILYQIIQIREQNIKNNMNAKNSKIFSIIKKYWDYSFVNQKLWQLSYFNLILILEKPFDYIVYWWYIFALTVVY